MNTLVNTGLQGIQNISLRTKEVRKLIFEKEVNSSHRSSPKWQQVTRVAATDRKCLHAVFAVKFPHFPCPLMENDPQFFGLKRNADVESKRGDWKRKRQDLNQEGKDLNEGGYFKMIGRLENYKERRPFETKKRH